MTWNGRSIKQGILKTSSKAILGEDTEGKDSFLWWADDWLNYISYNLQ